MAPARFGRYEVKRVLGRGGMGVVYEGHDPQIDRAVAVKTIALDALNDDEAAEFEARFRAEMRSAGRLLHPNIVALYDTGREAGSAYIVMEFVAGQDLRQRLAAGERFDVAQALAVGLQLLAALAYAHAHHVIHRDVKPANLMLQPDGNAKLCDFGVAHLADVDATRTRGMVVGTARYASPEQVAGAPIDARTDVYSAAVLIYELLAGKPPIGGRTEIEILAKIGQQTPPAPSTVNNAVPPALDGVLLRAMAKDPAQRFESAGAFAAALRSAAGMTGDTTAPLAAAAPAARRSRARWWGGAAALAGVASAALWWLWPKAALEAAAKPATRQAAPVAYAGAASAAASGAALAAALDGSWPGRYECGELVGPYAASARTEAFSANLKVEVHGPRIAWSRSGKTMHESVAGTIDGRGRFSAQGEGQEEATGRQSRWLVQANGFYNARARPPRLEGSVSLLRPKDRSLARNCTFSVTLR